MNSRLLFAGSRASANPVRHVTLHSQRQTRFSLQCQELRRAQQPPTRAFRAFTKLANHDEDAKLSSSYSQPAENLNHDVSKEEISHFEKAVAEDKEKQIRTPWHREGSDKPPVARQRSAGAMTKGKLLTTPSRMLKLILPLTTHDMNSDRKDVEPLALLVHPQQPLSYLERLIQSEAPLIKDKDGKEKIPNVYFRAEDSMQDDGADAKKPAPVEDEDSHHDEDHDLDTADTTMIDGKSARTGKLKKKQRTIEDALRGGHGEGGVESYSGLGHDAPNDKTEDRRFVRWSSSTEIGDFIRDAARGQEFAVEIEGAPRDIRVGVPSFADRTYYLRMRLRKKSREIAHLADVKRECDAIAEKGAKRVAMAGGVALVVWWGVVYALTFKTDLGWDVMEPVTYLVGLSTLIGGYIWFLIHNRQVSYRSAMNFTISRRQSQLYSQRGFDMRHWEDLVEEGNKLRAEIKSIAQEYDVDWNEAEDEQSEKVMKALKEERRKRKEGKARAKDEDEDEVD
ncbi:hypothetical protein EJ06DRAFT_581781 [Trichodelitschia bisporula]|uniref:Calcium uniporter protein, mitochondrial n=1 Tax=Trichodelitschia bisporula TaxID=703511 RepID=A0A6G1HY06_9PEZI|nr:hypothetical protein EJ06DRAFT_581781 [Trichodelitschia bisporula]